MAILYSILVHNSPRQTVRLLRALYNPDDQFVLHVDASSSDEYKNLIFDVGSCFHNVNVISTRVCQWGSIGLVQASLDMLELGLRLGSNWSHSILLSGTHLPLWPRERIVRWLRPGMSMFLWNDLQYNRGSDRWIRDMWDRIEHRYEPNPDGRMSRCEWLGRPEFTFVVGSQWVVLAREHVKYISCHSGSPIAKRLRESNVPDESYFQTILLNSDLKTECAWSESTLCYWDDGSWSPRTLNLEGYVAASKSDTRPFARKFADNMGPEGIVQKEIEQVVGTAGAEMFDRHTSSIALVRQLA